MEPSNKIKINSNEGFKKKSKTDEIAEVSDSDLSSLDENSERKLKKETIKGKKIVLNKNYKNKFENKQIKKKKINSDENYQNDLEMETMNEKENEIIKYFYNDKKLKMDNNSDENSEENEVELSEEDEKIIQMLYSKKYWTLKELSKDEQIIFIKKLVGLGDDNYKKQREKIFGTSKPDEYQYFLSDVFNSNFLTYDALIELSSFLYKKEPLTSNIAQEIKNIWKNPFNDLDLRDISGKRDRMKVMIGPTFQTKIIAGHIKLADRLRYKGLLNSNERQQMFYNYIIQTAERQYSKLSKEFWSSYLLHVVALGFIISLISIAVQAILISAGFVLFSPLVVLIVTTLVTTYCKFYENYKIWPWEWVYWWKDAKEQCLTCLKSEYMKEVLCEGKTEKTLDPKLGNSNNTQDDRNNQKESYLNKIKKFLGFVFKPLKNKKFLGFVFKIFVIIFILAALIYFFPSVVASAISAMLAFHEINLILTIPASFVSHSFWVAFAAAIGAIVCGIAYKINAKKYPQAQNDEYSLKKGQDDEFIKLRDDNDRKKYKATRDLSGFLFVLFAIILVLAALTCFYPSVVASAISAMLTICKINLTLTIPAPVVLAFWKGMITAAVVMIACGITYAINAKRYLKAKFNLYQKDRQPKGGKYFMGINKEHRYYTEEELKKVGIEVIGVNEQKPESQLKNDNTETGQPINSINS